MSVRSNFVSEQVPVLNARYDGALNQWLMVAEANPTANEDQPIIFQLQTPDSVLPIVDCHPQTEEVVQLQPEESVVEAVKTDKRRTDKPTPSLLPCPHCVKSFRRKGALKTHVSSNE